MSSIPEASAAGVADRLAAVRQRLRAAEIDAGREPGSIALLAVSKTKPVADIRAALAAGQHAFGENYLDEAQEKIAALKGERIDWHFIGAIQSNKTRQIATHFDWAHGVDREKIARRLGAQRPAGKGPLNICLQVNPDAEPSKAGVDPAGLPALAAAVDGLPGIRLRGLMAIPAPRADFAAQRAICARLRRLFESLRDAHPSVDTLSMGMSADLEAAVAEGSTLLRIGTAIFGARPPAA